MKQVTLLFLILIVSGCTTILPETIPTETVDLQDGQTYDLTADNVLHEIAGTKFPMYAYNNQIPGPTLEATQDTSVRILFNNKLDEPTTVHWHGLRQDNKDDGVPDITQPPVDPGESYNYDLFFPDAGIFWYHPHVREDRQQDLGLAGLIYVKPNDASAISVNRHELLVFDDILMDGSKLVTHGEDKATHAVMGRFGNLMLTNGKSDFTMDARKGEIIRFYLANTANVRPFNISFGGAKMKLIGSDLSNYETEQFVSSIIIHPAERYIVDVYFEESRTYNIIHSNPQSSYTMGLITVSGTTDVDHSKEFAILQKDEKVISDIAKFKSSFDKPLDYTIDLDVLMGGMMGNMMGGMMGMSGMPCHQMPDGSMMGNCDGNKETIEWEDTMSMMSSMSTDDVSWIIRDRESGKENMDFMMHAKVGDVIKIRMINKPDSMHPMQHPIHLHGQRFLVTSIDGKSNQNLAWKDTVIVPIGSTVDILVDVTNPGDWMFHCHIAEHLESGMMAMLSVS